MPAHTLHLVLWDSPQMKELFYLPNPYLSLVLSFIFLSLLYFIAVYLVLQGLGKWDTERAREGEREPERKTKWCVYYGATWVCWSLWESPLAFTLRFAHTGKRAPAHTFKDAQVIFVWVVVEDKWGHKHCKPKSERPIKWVNLILFQSVLPLFNP